MSSQKYAKLVMAEAGNWFWNCKLMKEECGVLNMSTSKPMCDRCMVAKDHKKNVKAGKEIMRSIRERKEESDA